jgi:valyl-tRNA synthetase
LLKNSTYNHAEAEKRWQEYWEKHGVHHWDETAAREDTYVIDTPPPTVSGLLHMGHIFSYTQADFIARFQRMNGKTVFYPMGFDDNGLPTERLVEKARKIRASDLPREEFIKICQEVVIEAEEEFRRLFRSVALSIDWRQEYQTISEFTRRLSQESFLDLLQKGHAYRQLQPMLWDPVDQTAIAQAEVEDKEMDSHFCDIWFDVEASDQNPEPRILIGTTRPELIPACVAIFYHPEDTRYQHLKGANAITPLFGVRVPILEDDTVDMEKGTGIMMCCTFGDEADIDKWRRHNLPMRVVLNKYGKMEWPVTSGQWPDGCSPENWQPTTNNLLGLKATNKDPKHPGAREKIIEMLEAEGLLKEKRPIVHAVKCAERSGAALEILPTPQWFVKVLDKKEDLLKRARECEWKPEYMRLRIEQWIEGLRWDWCISRQRYFGVPFPVWYKCSPSRGERDLRSAPAPQIREGVRGMDLPPHDSSSASLDSSALPQGESYILPHQSQLPVNPLTDLPLGYKGAVTGVEGKWSAEDKEGDVIRVIEIASGNEVLLKPDVDVMDTWATSSISPQINAGVICSPLRGERDLRSALAPQIREGVHGMDLPPHDSSSASLDSSALPQGESARGNLFPADLRPQAHEIIRSWAFYTIVKAHLHSGVAPWKNLMISGWCLASDKTKMSKSKGNVVTPVELIEEKGTDAVRYWASTSKLGADTAFSEDLLKIGRKLVTKVWNAANFASQHFGVISPPSIPPVNGREDSSKIPLPPAGGARGGHISESLDLWILSRLHRTVAEATEEFHSFEYSDARAVVENFFWNDFCDNYLEMVKTRSYGESCSPQSRLSAIYTLYYVLDGVLRLFAPFIPHVTEDIWSQLYPEKFAATKSIHARGNWPVAADYPLDERAEAAGIIAVEVLESVRRAKSDAKVSIKFPVEKIVIATNAENITLIKMVELDLKAASNAELITYNESQEELSVNVKLAVVADE